MNFDWTDDEASGPVTVTMGRVAVPFRACDQSTNWVWGLCRLAEDHPGPPAQVVWIESAADWSGYFGAPESTRLPAVAQALSEMLFFAARSGDVETCILLAAEVENLEHELNSVADLVQYPEHRLDGDDPLDPSPLLDFRASIRAAATVTDGFVTTADLRRAIVDVRRLLAS